VLFDRVKHAEIAAKIDIDPDRRYFAVTRPLLRTPTRLVDENTAELLKLFREPKRIVTAVKAFAKKENMNTEELLRGFYPVAKKFYDEQILIRPDDSKLLEIHADWKPGKEIGLSVIERVMFLKSDTEIYQARRAGKSICVKRVRVGATSSTAALLRREAAILRQIDLKFLPHVHEFIDSEDGPFLIMGWAAGSSIENVAQELRALAGPDITEYRNSILRLIRSLLNAYAILHENHILHGDIHPQNILVTADLSVNLIDFGLARVPESFGIEPHPSTRGCVVFFMEPELAQAYLEKRSLNSSFHGEQYCLATLVFRLITGKNYLSFSMQSQKLHRQVVEESPLTFAEVGMPPWPEMESILRRALAKNPQDRFSSVREFLDHLPLSIPAKLWQESRTEAPRSLDPDSAKDSIPIPSGAKVLYGGTLSLAYAQWRLAEISGENSYLYRARDLLDHASQEKEVEENPYIAPITGASGVSFLKALISASLSRPNEVKAAVSDFLSIVSRETKSMELFRGKAGVLVGIQQLIHRFRRLEIEIDPAPLQEHGWRIFGELIQWVREVGPFADVDEIEHSGMAHGWAGILYGLTRWTEAYPEMSVMNRETLKSALIQLGKEARPEMRGLIWPHDLRKSKIDFGNAQSRSSFCSGSAGFVMLFKLAFQVFPEEPKFHQWAMGAAWTASDLNIQGEVDLCCGVTGRAYSLSRLCCAFPEENELAKRAHFLAHYAAHSDQWGASNHPPGLFRSKIASELLLMDRHESHRGASCFPCIEDEV